MATVSTILASFNSLRTGKHIQRRSPYLCVRSTLCFNSLRTGKHIQRNKRALSKGGEGGSVSIPYERESISKEKLTIIATEGSTCKFQFPTNGKAYPKSVKDATQKVHLSQFQFPTNGKAYPKEMLSKAYSIGLLVLFQFPTNGKAYPKPWKQPEHTWCYTFQFPTNGKAYPKGLKPNTQDGKNQFVFQFPTNGKAYPKPYTPWEAIKKVESFNSLRTGKHIQSGVMGE